MMSMATRLSLHVALRRMVRHLGRSKARTARLSARRKMKLPQFRTTWLFKYVGIGCVVTLADVWNP